MEETNVGGNPDPDPVTLWLGLQLDTVRVRV